MQLMEEVRPKLSLLGLGVGQVDLNALNLKRMSP